MDYKIEKTVTYCEERELKNLYKWYLLEDIEKKLDYPKKLVPYWSSVFFFASKLELSRNINVEFNDQGDDFETKSFAESGENIVISGSLHSGRCINGKNLEYDVRYSLFGTDREVKEFSIRIQKSIDGVELCHFNASLSYEYELDFYTEELPDCVHIDLCLNEEKFNNLVKLVEAKSIDSVILTLGQVRGFYSVWSPQLYNREVKILTGDVEIDELKDGVKIYKVGEVGKCDLSLLTTNKLNIKNNFQHESVEHMFQDELTDNSSNLNTKQSVGDVRIVKNNYPDEIHQLNKNLSTIKSLAWAAIVILILIFINVSNIDMS